MKRTFRSSQRVQHWWTLITRTSQWTSYLKGASTEEDDKDYKNGTRKRTGGKKLWLKRRKNQRKKIVQLTPWSINYSKVMNTPGSRLAGDEYTGELRLLGGEYTRQNWRIKIF